MGPQSSLACAHCRNPTGRMVSVSHSQPGNVAMGAPQLDLNSAGDEGLLKSTMSPGSPGLQDHKYLDLRGRRSKRGTEL